MRVIAGRFRGRQLVSFKADHIRPTTDRVKESVFNKLQNDIPGARVLDLFSGTGNLAIEALSRGAGEVTAVEVHKRSLAIIRENLEKLGIKGEIAVVAADVLQYVRSYSGQAYDVILVDPPFTEKMADEVLQALASAPGLLTGDGVVMVEASTHETVRASYQGRGFCLERFDDRDYGDKIVSYFRKTVSEGIGDVKG